MSRRAPQEAGERTRPLDAMLSSRFHGILKREVATCTRYNLSRVRACQAPSCYMHRGSDPHSPHSEEGPTLTRHQRAHLLTLEPPPPPPTTGSLVRPGAAIYIAAPVRPVAFCNGRPLPESRMSSSRAHSISIPCSHYKWAQAG